MVSSQAAAGDPMLDDISGAGLEGTLLKNHPLRDITWFRVGGAADIFFLPQDENDLAEFLQRMPTGMPLTVIGVGSNILVRDGGIRGCVIRLGGGFAAIRAEGSRIIAGAGALDAQVAKCAARAGIAGLEFLRGIPGSIGGAVKMNAGAYGGEVRDRLVEIAALDPAGECHVLKNDGLGFRYRHSALPEGYIVTQATFEGVPGDVATIEARMAGIMQRREQSQPIRSQTGGSTFKNPDPAQSDGRSAWQMVEAVGGRGRRYGQAQMSALHCNFMVNLGEATATELEQLGESIRADVLTQEGVQLEWEIKIIGEPA